MESDESDESDESLCDRLYKLKKYASSGCSCVSFYDWIVLYPTDLNIKMFNIDIPIDYIESKLQTNNQYKFNASIVYNITFSEFLVYDNIRNIILNKHIDWLSVNPYIPFSYITDHPEYEWKYNRIAMFNTTLREVDLYNPNLINLDHFLSHNQNIPIDWIIRYEDKCCTFWNWASYSSNITIKQLNYLRYYHPDCYYGRIMTNKALNWQNVMNSINITAEDIIAHPEHPWQYALFKHATIEYYNYVKNKISKADHVLLINNICGSDRIDIYDLIDNDIPITKNIYNNANISYDDVYGCGLYPQPNDDDLLSLSYNTMKHPKLKLFYQQIYSKIIVELKYLH